MNGITRFFSAEVKGWPEWWRSQKGFYRHGLLILLLSYWGILSAMGALRGDHFTMGLIMLGFWYAGRTGRVLFHFLVPIFLTGVVYDSQRYFGHYIRKEVHVAFPYEFDKRFFGIDTPEGRLTPNEFWQTRTKAWLDLITGFFYLCFIAIYIGISFHQRFILPAFSRKPSQRKRASEIGNGFTWAFFWLNVLGYSTYYWFPAAPPWYVAEHGLGPAKLDTPPSAAGCLRFDELLGTNFFTGMYERSADVFGAIPSLHISYPLLAMLFAYHLGSLRAFTTFFYLVMCFSAVYLNHHYVLDLIWGSAYAVLIYWVISFYERMKRRTKLPSHSELI